MTGVGFQVGNHVGIKDSPDFNHWSRRGAVTGPAAEAGLVNVLIDGASEPLPMLPAVLVKLASSWDEPHSDEWFAQAFPKNGDPPGEKMYFCSAVDVLAFVAQFEDAELDEIIKVHVPAGATDADRTILRAEGAVEL